MAVGGILLTNVFVFFGLFLMSPGNPLLVPEVASNMAVAAKHIQRRRRVFDAKIRAHRGEHRMLFHVTWDFIDLSEAGQKRSLQLFSKWQPGPGQFQAFHGLADGEAALR